MPGTPIQIMLVACAASLLGGCGDDERVVSTPPVSQPPPFPPPPPAPPPPTAQAPFGVTADTDFATVGDVPSFRWSASLNAYEMTLPDGTDHLLVFGGIQDEGYEYHYVQSTGVNLHLRNDLDYQYTNYATLIEGGWGNPVGDLAFGIPTEEGDVPVTGTASYTAEARGGDGRVDGPYDYYPHTYVAFGSATLNFDFGKGTLSGHFDPEIANYGGGWVSLGRYSFVNTVHGVGSTTFSGELDHPNLTELGAFEGMFTGPQAVELLSRWQIPYLNPWTDELGTLHGVWIGQKND